MIALHNWQDICKKNNGYTNKFLVLLSLFNNSSN